MKNQGYPETTLKPALRRLNMLSREANLDPEDVKAVIASRRTTNGYKQSLTEIYNHYVKANDLTWGKPFLGRKRGFQGSPQQRQ